MLIGFYSASWRCYLGKFHDAKMVISMLLCDPAEDNMAVEVCDNANLEFSARFQHSPGMVEEGLAMRSSGVSKPLSAMHVNTDRTAIRALANPAVLCT